MIGSYYHAFMHYFYKLCCHHKQLQELDTEPFNILVIMAGLPYFGGSGGSYGGVFLGELRTSEMNVRSIYFRNVTHEGHASCPVKASSNLYWATAI